MSSYNNIRKIKYTKNPSDVVSLQEYIMFEDSHAKEKYVVFKFSNNLNQRLLSFKFEVLQYNRDNELLERSVVVHENFIAEANDLFVPNAKLKVNFECESLEVKLESASFDRVIWSNGEFKDNSFSFESYAETVAKPARSSKSSDDKKKTKEKKKKKNKLGFIFRDVSRRNRAIFPSIFNVFLCIVVIGLVVFSTFYFKRVTNAFAIDGFVLEESSTGYVTILDYTGGEDTVTIPAKLESEDESYYVTKIAKGAFSNSTVKSIEFYTSRSLTIETGAFVKCSRLTDVIGDVDCGEIVVMEGAFTNCTALASFVVPTSRLCRKCFDGTDNIKNFEFGDVVFTEGRLLDVFNGLKNISFKYFPKYDYYLRSFPEFVEGVSVNR